MNKKKNLCVPNYEFQNHSQNLDERKYSQKIIQNLSKLLIILLFMNSYLQLVNQFSAFNQFNVRLTEQLWCLDLENKTGLFPSDEWETHTGKVILDFR